MLAKILSQRHGFQCTVLFSVGPGRHHRSQGGNSLSDGAALEQADAIVMSLRFRHWPDADMARFAARLNAGVPIVALRTSTHAFNGFPDGARGHRGTTTTTGGFGKRVLGETWLTHWGRHKVEGTRGVIEPAQRATSSAARHRRIAGDTDVYEAYPPGDATVLVRGLVLTTLAPDSAPADYKKRRSTDKVEQGVNDPAMPVVWTRINVNDNGTQNRDPDDDDGIGHGPRERRPAAAAGERRLLGARPATCPAKADVRLRRSVRAVVLRLRRLPQGPARLRLRARQGCTRRAASPPRAGAGRGNAPR